MTRAQKELPRSFPAELVPSFYRTEYPEVANFSSALVRQHFALYGRPEGRCGNHVRTRADFVDLMPKKSTILEIGPYFTPIVQGENVRYFDVLPQEGLIARAISQGVEKASPPNIHYVSPVGDLTIVPDKFDFAVSSYCLEHQPDLIKHLRDVQNLLHPGGCYFMLVPDKRYCHDHFMAESTLAGVLDAHHSGQTVHPLRSIIEHVALSAHNDHFRHWAGDHGVYLEDFDQRCQVALDLHRKSSGGYVDVHSWYFTPDSTQTLIKHLKSLNYINLEVARCYSTRIYNNDFWMILQKPMGAQLILDPDDGNSTTNAE